MGSNISTLPERRSVFPSVLSPKVNNNNNNNNLISNFQQKGVPGASFSPKISRIVNLHSAAQWRAYLESSKQTNKLIVIDFTAAWCGPCRYMDPTFNEFAEKYTDVNFVKIDVDELMDVAQEFGVQAMPTFLLLKKGREVDKVVGVKKEDLQRKIERHRVSYN